jgi:hypothetical protein
LDELKPVRQFDAVLLLRALLTKMAACALEKPRVVTNKNPPNVRIRKELDIIISFIEKRGSRPQRPVLVAVVCVAGADRHM